MMRAAGWICMALLLGCGNAKAESWTCTLVEGHRFVQGKDVAQRGGGDYLVQVKPPKINLVANGHFIIDYKIVENSRFRLFGERRTDMGGGESRTARLTLDKLHGRIGHSGFRHKGDTDELEEITNGRCVDGPD